MINASELTLSPTKVDELAALFAIQLDAEGQHMAAFTPKDPSDKNAYLEKYTKLLAEPTVNMQTLILDQAIIGSISKFEMEGNAEITYWIDKPFWGQGIATVALKKLLQNEPARPIFGRVAFDNIGSQRVLEKCDFKKIGTDKGFANARQEEIQEIIYKLA